MKDYKLVYNPKKFNGKVTPRVRDIYGAREGNRQEGKLIEKPGVYEINSNELKKFRVDIADYLLSKYGFLQEVEPRKVDEILKQMKEKLYKCKLCNFETDTKIALAGHMRTHKLSEEAQKLLEEIPEATPSAYVIGAEYSKSKQTELISPEAAEGIPLTRSDDPRARGSVDGDGVEWYGEGLKSDRVGGQQAVIRGGTPGQRPTRRAAFSL